MKMAGRHALLALSFLYIVIRVTAKYPALSSYSSLQLIKDLASSKNAPLIVVIDPKQSGPQQLPDADFDEFFSGDGGVRGSVIDIDDESDQDAKEQAKAMLFRYLRSSPDDSQSEKQKKHALREALRKRCMIVQICEIQCAKPKKKCPKKCKQKYDEEDLCSPRPKRGRTMPPSWLL